MNIWFYNGSIKSLNLNVIRFLLLAIRQSVLHSAHNGTSISRLWLHGVYQGDDNGTVPSQQQKHPPHNL